jgi:hypothetical protein
LEATVLADQIDRVIVPNCMRANWRQEWEAELKHREMLLPKGNEAVR